MSFSEFVNLYRIFYSTAVFRYNLAMEILRDPNVQSGFRFERPLDNWPVLTHCGEAACSSRHYVDSHIHTGFEFTFIDRGRLRVSTDGKTYSLKAGDLFIAYPNEAHWWSDRDHEGFQQIWIGLDLAGLGNYGGILSERLQSNRRHVLMGAHDVEPVLRGIIRQVMRRDPQHRQVIEAHLETFAALVMQRLAIEARNSVEEPLQGSSAYSYEIDKVIRFMQANADRRIPLDEFVNVCGLSTSWFARRFHDEVGISPNAYHLRLRLEAAREALRQPDASVTDVALAHGFSSSQHFCAAFNQAYHTSPGKWRHSLTTAGT